MNERKYYQAYDDRYRQVHEKELRWFAKNPTPIVGEMIRAFSIPKEHRLLEIGCGEGRDAIPLLRDGYDLLATDVSEEAIAYCRAQAEGFEQCFATFDCVTETLSQAGGDGSIRRHPCIKVGGGIDKQAYRFFRIIPGADIDTVFLFLVQDIAQVVGVSRHLFQLVVHT